MRCGAALAAFLVAGALPLPAQTIVPAPLRSGTIAFAMRATTVNDFTGHVTVARAEVHGADLAGATGTVEVRVAEMQTGIGLRDRHLRNALHADSFPTIRFDLERLEPGETHGDTIAVTYQGHLSIHGVTRPVRAPGWVILRQPGAEAHAEFPLDMREYGITPPTRFFGAVKVDPSVGLTVQLVFGN